MADIDLATVTPSAIDATDQVVIRRGTGSGETMELVPVSTLRAGIAIRPDDYAENTTPGTTDMTAAIAAAAAAADNGGVVSGSGQAYGISSPIDISALFNVTFRDIKFYAIGTWASGDAMLDLTKLSASRSDLTFENCFFEGNHKANGLYVAYGSRVTVNQCKSHGVPDYAVRSRTSAGELLISNCNFRQYYYGESGWNVAANRTADLIDIATPDAIVSATAAAYCRKPIVVSTYVYHVQVIGCHFYNDGYTPVSGQAYCADFSVASAVITDNYFDNGLVSVDAAVLSGGSTLTFTGSIFYKGTGTNANALEFRNSGAAVSLDGVELSGGFEGFTTADAVLFTGSFSSPLLYSGGITNGFSLPPTNMPVMPFPRATWDGLTFDLSNADVNLQDNRSFLVGNADPTKKALFGLGGIPTATTNVYYFPAVGGNILVDASSATLTGNWTMMGSYLVYDSSMEIVDASDVTKVGKFQAGGITAGTTRIYTLPDADGTLALDRSVAATLAFGGTFTDKAQTVVTGQAWVAADSKIMADVLTPSGTDPDEMYLLNFRPVISDIVPGTGFTVTLYSEAQARGSYTVNCMGA